MPDVARPIRVLVVDDHPVVRQALSDLLNAAADIEVIGTASDGEEAVRVALASTPDVVLMDISMPKKNGIEATNELLRSCPESRVIVLTSSTGLDPMLAATGAGAVATIHKDAETHVIFDSIRRAVRR